jgi:hypothetical protein
LALHPGYGHAARTREVVPGYNSGDLVLALWFLGSLGLKTNAQGIENPHNGGKLWIAIAGEGAI